jgi:adenylate cyclase
MLADFFSWLEAQETILSAIAASIVVLSVVGAAARSAFKRTADTARATLSRQGSNVDVSAPVPGFGGRAAIAVLPFDNMSGDADQEYFADGITEDIITSLQSYRSFPVIARNSSFTYKGTSPDVRAVAKELGVGYVLEGSVRRAGDQVRITAQLIDAEGHHVWAERFDSDYTDVLKLQDEITLQIVGAVAPEIDRTDASAASQKRSQDLAAWDYLLHAQALIHQISPEALRQAKGVLEKAIGLDPQFAHAHALLARIWFLNGFDHSGRALGEDPMESFGNAAAQAKHALSIDSSNPLAHGMLSVVHMFMGQVELGLKEGAEAVRLNPSDAQLRVYAAGPILATADFAKALDQIRLGKRLSPNDIGMWEFLMVESFALFGLGDYEEAEQVARQAVEERKQNPMAQAILIASLDVLGRKEEACEAFSKMIQILPDFSPDSFHPVYGRAPDTLSQLFESLCNAGWEKPD